MAICFYCRKNEAAESGDEPPMCGECEAGFQAYYAEMEAEEKARPAPRAGRFGCDESDNPGNGWRAPDGADAEPPTLRDGHAPPR
jgi:hypothetical protein